MPRLIACRDNPHARCTNETPPNPKLIASFAAVTRRVRTDLETHGVIRDGLRAPPAADPLSSASSAVKNHGCADSSTNLCLNDDRFRVEVSWRDYFDNTGSGQVAPLGSNDSGLLWFFNSNNWEMLVKVLDGCPVNNHYWVFAAATTDVEYTLTVTDTAHDLEVQYPNALGIASPAITEITAFATCP